MDDKSSHREMRRRNRKRREILTGEPCMLNYGVAHRAQDKYTFISVLGTFHLKQKDVNIFSTINYTAYFTHM